MLASDHNGPGGEQELATNVTERLVASKDRDNTGDDLNLIYINLEIYHPQMSACSVSAHLLDRKSFPRGGSTG